MRPYLAALGLLGALGSNPALADVPTTDIARMATRAAELTGDTGVASIVYNPDVTFDNEDLLSFPGDAVLLIYSSDAQEGIPTLRNDIAKGLFDFLDDNDRLERSPNGDIGYFLVDSASLAKTNGWDSAQTFSHLRETYGLPEGGGPFMILYGAGQGTLDERELDRLVGGTADPESTEAWEKRLTAWVGTRLVKPDSETVYGFEHYGEGIGQPIHVLPEDASADASQ